MMQKKIIYVFKALNTDLTLYKIGKTINSKDRFIKHNSPLANYLEILFQYETDNIDQVELCAKALMKTAQYKELYQIDLDIIKQIIKTCDLNVAEINNKIKGGGTQNEDIKEKLFLLIPKTI